MNVTIVDDDIVEDTEDFFGSLTTTDSAVFLDPDRAQVIITEDPTDRKKYYTQPHEFLWL